MLSFFRSLRYLRRYRRIVAVLTRHGLGWLADQLGLSRFLAWPRRLLRRQPLPQPISSLAQRLCHALEELGPSFVLLGRYLSTRLDVLPPSLCRELDCLPRGAPALPAAQVRQTVEGTLGSPLASLFAEYEPVPWRRTWLEEVHCARTPEGQEVWVAVPNTATHAALEEAQPLFQDLARQIDEHRPLGWRGSASRLWQEFRGALWQEMDSSERGHNVERWRQNFAPRDGPAFPEVDWDRTAAQVLTCYALPGRPLAEAASAGAGGLDGLARALYRFFGLAIFVDGFYPAPPALDGLLVLADGRLALTALAPAGYLDRSIRQGLWEVLEHFQQEDLSGIVDACAALGLLGRRDVSAAVHQTVRHLVERYQGVPLGELRLGELAGDVFALAGRGPLALPAEINLLLRTLAAVEDLGRRLAPGVGAAVEMAPAVRQAMSERHSWATRGERIVRGGQSWMRALHSFPADANRLLSSMVNGDLTVGLEPRGWQKPMRRLERMVYRLVVSLVGAGLLIGLGLLASALLPAGWGAWGWVLAGGALASVFGLGLLLLLSLLRRG